MRIRKAFYQLTIVKYLGIRASSIWPQNVREFADSGFSLKFGVSLKKTLVNFIFRELGWSLSMLQSLIVVREM